MLSQPSTRRICLLSLCTLGLYFYYWCYHSAQDIKQVLGASAIAQFWLLFLPFGNYWWMWQYSSALDNVTNRRVSASDTFLIYILSTSVLAVPYSGLRIYFDIHPKIARASDLVPILIVAGVGCLIMAIFHSALFCSIIQKRINNAKTAH